MTHQNTDQIITQKVSIIIEILNNCTKLSQVLNNCPKTYPQNCLKYGGVMLRVDIDPSNTDQIEIQKVSTNLI